MPNRPRRGRGSSGLDDEVVLPSAARTTTGSVRCDKWGGHDKPAVKLDITAASGTPTLDVVVQDSADGTTWTTVDTFPQKTGANSSIRTMPRATKRFVRVNYTIGGGTPSLTFSVIFAAIAANLTIQKTGS